MAPKESRAAKIVDYYDGKLWFHKKAGNILILGITLDGLDEIGEVESINLPSEGDDFDKDDVIADIEGSMGSLSLVAPAAGFVTETNSAVEEDLSILAEDPIDEGWLVKIEMQDDTDLKEYM